MKKLVLLAMATVLLLGSCQVLSLLGIGGDDKQQDQVELRLNLNGGTGSAATVQKFNPGQTATTPPRPAGWTYTGHQFIGWDTRSDGQGDPFQPGDSIMMLSSITLYAQWRALGHPYSISELDSRLNGITARLLVFEEEYDITSALGADGPPEETLAFGHAIITNRNIIGNLWKYEGWIDDPDPDDPNMLPWQPTSGTNYEVYILVEFDQSAPELVVGAGSSIGTYTINPLATFSSATSWNLTATTEVYLRMDQGHSYSITGFDTEWNGELALVMVFPGDLVLAETVGAETPPPLAALGFGEITGGTLTGGFFHTLGWDEMEDPTDMDRRPWYPASGEDYLVAVMLPNWQLVFFGAGTDLEIDPPVINALASGLTRETDSGTWNVSLTTAVAADMDTRSGHKYKVDGIDSQHADQTAIMLVFESPVDWPAVMNSGDEGGGPPDGILAFGWRWIGDEGTVFGGLYNMFPEVWDAFDSGNRDEDSWTPWYPDSTKSYEMVMMLPEAGLAYFGAGSNFEAEPQVINALAVKPGEEPRWRLSASTAAILDMGREVDEGEDQDILVLTSIAGIYSERWTVQGDPNFWNQNGELIVDDTSHATAEGAEAMKVVFNLPDFTGDGSSPWLQINYGRASDISALDYLVFSLDQSELTSLHSLQIIFWSGADGLMPSSVQLSDYTASTIAATYSTYRIPLAALDAHGLDRGIFWSISVGWPVDAAGESVSGTLYFDDIYFE